MRKIFLILLTISLEFILLSKSVFAYLDPSTGIVILNSIWLAIVALFSAISLFIAKKFWGPIKKRVTKLRKNKTETKSN